MAHSIWKRQFNVSKNSFHAEPSFCLQNFSWSSGNFIITLGTAQTSWLTSQSVYHLQWQHLQFVQDFLIQATHIHNETIFMKWNKNIVTSKLFIWNLSMYFYIKSQFFKAYSVSVFNRSVLCTVFNSWHVVSPVHCTMQAYFRPV
jgi:hypothetical protein